MIWVWADRKNHANKRPHGGLSFETAKLVFDDLLALSRKPRAWPDLWFCWRSKRGQSRTRDPASKPG
jgi:hypothetical protein